MAFVCEGFGVWIFGVFATVASNVRPSAQMLSGSRDGKRLHRVKEPFTFCSVSSLGEKRHREHVAVSRNQLRP